jgi:hypothetical protein
MGSLTNFLEYCGFASDSSAPVLETFYIFEGEASYRQGVLDEIIRVKRYINRSNKTKLQYTQN